MSHVLDDLESLPGAELVLPGLADLVAGRDTIEALLVEIAAPRLRRLGLEVPLLVEAPVFAEIADVVLAIVAPETVRAARAVARGMDSEDAQRRIHAQATDAERVQLADATIINDGSVERFLGDLDAFWEEYVAVGGVAR